MSVFTKVYLHDGMTQYDVKDNIRIYMKNGGTKRGIIETITYDEVVIVWGISNDREAIQIKDIEAIDYIDG